MQYDICFFFNDAATTEIYTLSLHDALPISAAAWSRAASSSSHRSRSAPTAAARPTPSPSTRAPPTSSSRAAARSEEHTSELQSRQYLVCRLLLEKKKQIQSDYAPR